MPHRNRVTPLGELVDTGQGLVFGNRGCLHDDAGRIRRHHDGRRWIACRLQFKGRRRELLRPGHYTELFFLDDATALAAGHRPCAECRREDFRAFAAIWAELHPGPATATAIDARLHAERLTGDGRQQHHQAATDDLPDGAFVLREGAPWVVAGPRLVRWTPTGYADAVPRPSHHRATVLTPPSTVAVLQRGWRPGAVPLLHPSAERPHGR